MHIHGAIPYFVSGGLGLLASRVEFLQVEADESMVNPILFYFAGTGLYYLVSHYTFPPLPDGSRTREVPDHLLRSLGGGALLALILKPYKDNTAKNLTLGSLLLGMTLFGFSMNGVALIFSRSPW